ncbi:hypothetical protein EBZ37_11245, partial [bacterium]|nr:hypothetical protein [bacterium]
PQESLVTNFVNAYKTYGGAREALISLFGRSQDATKWKKVEDPTLRDLAAKAESFINVQLAALSSLLDATGSDKNPKIILETIPVVSKNPALPIATSRTENIARNYWRSDMVRLNTQVLNAHRFPSKLRQFQIEIQVYDSQSVSQQASNQGSPNGTLRRTNSNLFGPNCSYFGKKSAIDLCDLQEFGTNGVIGSDNAPVYLISPNLIRYSLKSVFDPYSTKSDLSDKLYPSSEAPVEVTDSNYFDSAGNATSPVKPKPTRLYLARVETPAGGALQNHPLASGRVYSFLEYSRATLRQSCKISDFDSIATTPRPLSMGSWQSMRCPAAPAAPFFPSNYLPRGVNEAQWEITRQATGTLLGSPTFNSEVPSINSRSYDPIELLFYDFYQLGGTDALSTSDSFAARTSRLSWDFARPKEYNPTAFATEASSNVAISGQDATEAQAYIEANSLPTTAYTPTYKAELASKLWSAQAAADSVLTFSILNQCVILPSVNTLVGFMTCDRFKIEPRTQPLNLIGTFMIGQLDLPSPLS